jgi:hypothetical protein
MALSASESGVLQPSLPNGSLPPAAGSSERTFSAAPTVMTFLAVPGEPTVCTPDPAFPAANTITICWFPAVGNGEPGGCASRTSASYDCASTS